MCGLRCGSPQSVHGCLVVSAPFAKGRSVCFPPGLVLVALHKISGSYVQALCCCCPLLSHVSIPVPSHSPYRCRVEMYLKFVLTQDYFSYSRSVNACVNFNEKGSWHSIRNGVDQPGNLLPFQAVLVLPNSERGLFFS